MIYKVNITDKDGVVTDVTDNVQVGFSDVEKFVDSLDIGQMEIALIDREEPFGMFDLVDIYIDEKILSYRIASDDPTIESKNPLKYTHTVTFTEIIKILERHNVMGFTVRQPTDLSFTYTLYDVAERLRLTQPLEKSILIDQTRLFKIPDETKAILEQIVSPEFTWNGYTLRQCLDELCSVVDGIAKLDRNNNFTIQFFNETFDMIASIDETFNDKRRSQDIEFYGTNMDLLGVNLINDNQYAQSVEQYPANGYTTIRSDDYYLDCLKSYIPTPKPVYDKQKVFNLCELTVDILFLGDASGD